MSDHVILRSDKSFVTSGNAPPQEPLLGFSPDIVFIKAKTKFDPNTLSETYARYTSTSLLPGTKYKIWARGKLAPKDKSTSVKAPIIVRAVPNELILWPQVWNAADKTVGTVTLDTIKDGVCIPKTPIDFTLTDALNGGEEGRHVTFIANVNKLSSKSTANASTWNDLADKLGKDTAFATHSVLWAKASAKVVKLKSRLRFFQHAGTSTSLNLYAECLVTPTTGVEIEYSVTDKNGKAILTHARSGFAPGSVPKNSFTISEASFDGWVHMTIYNETAHRVWFNNKSHISLAVEVVKKTKPGSPSVSTLLGIEHILFDPHLGPVEHMPYPFYFRAHIGDIDEFPRKGFPSYSPDIQPMGQSPIANAKETLKDMTKDHATGSLVSHVSNFVYVRGTATEPIKGQVRLWAVPSSLLTSPSEFTSRSDVIPATRVDPVTQQAVPDFASIEADEAGPAVSQYPLVLHDVPAPPSGNHYCFIAEYRPAPTNGNPNPPWPHESAPHNMTWDGMIDWVLRQPCYCWRNVGYTTIADAPSYTHQTAFQIKSRDGFTPSSIFDLKMLTHGLPHGSSVQLEAYPVKGTFPTDLVLSYPKTKITVDDEAFDDLQFTGVSGNAEFTVYVYWYAEGTKPNPDQSITVEFAYVPGHGQEIEGAEGVPVKVNKKLLAFHDYPLFDNAHHRTKARGAFPSAKKVGLHTPEEDQATHLYKKYVVGTQTWVFKKA